MLLNDFDEIRRTYKLDLVSELAACYLDDVSGVHFQHVRKANIMALKRAGLIQEANELPDRLHWEFFQQSSFERLVKALAKCNSRLHKLLGGTEHEVMQEDFRLIELLFVSERSIPQLLDFQHALEVAHASDMAAIMRPAAIKGLRIIFEDIEDSLFSPEEKSRFLESMGIHPNAPNLHLWFLDPDCSTATPSLARYDGHPVYLEWVAVEKTDSAITFERLHNLAALLHAPKPSTLCVLHCRGYIDDFVRSRCCLVFDFPAKLSSSSTLTPPHSLSQLLDSSFTPGVTARVDLARALANCVLQLQVANWPHRGLRSENILFFSASPGMPPAFDKPYLVGFEHSDMATAEVDGLGGDMVSAWGEHSFCQHRQTQDSPRPMSPLEKEYDVYSLGLVLVEVARWKSVKTMVESEAQVIKDVSFHMGGRYVRATQRCLHGAPEGAGPEDQLQTFFRHVVLRLQRIVV